MELIRKQRQTTTTREKNGVVYLQYDQYTAIPELVHTFSTRLGGVSTGDAASMNFSYERDTDDANVLENFRRMGAAIGFTPEQAVKSHQTHTVNVRRVTKEDCGKGVTRPRDYDDVDGLITDERGIMLVTSYADCVPLYFYDRVHHAIGLSHSGWRGTVNRMGKVTLQEMANHFGTRPEDVLCCIGPSICKDCYEVSRDVIDAFEAEFSPKWWPLLYEANDKGGYQLDLWKANQIILEEAGVPANQIALPDVCTCCNPSILFSHRASKGKRGNLAAFLMLRDDI